jgi:ribosome-binding factor A
MTGPHGSSRANPRAKKLGAAIRSELAEMIARELKDPRLQRAGLLTISNVEVQADLRIARVWISFAGGDDREAPPMAIEALTGAAGYLRGELGRRLGIKRTPELRFAHDESVAYTQHIDELLRSDPPRSSDVAAEAAKDHDDE